MQARRSRMLTLAIVYCEMQKQKVACLERVVAGYVRGSKCRYEVEGVVEGEKLPVLIREPRIASAEDLYLPGCICEIRIHATNSSQLSALYRVITRCVINRKAEFSLIIGSTKNTKANYRQGSLLTIS